MNKVDRPSIIRSLLDAGAHIDRGNLSGQTPIEFIKRSGDIQPLQYQSLKCLCAKAILQNKIHFHGGRIPVHLENFVEMH